METQAESQATVHQQLISGIQTSLIQQIISATSEYVNLYLLPRPNLSKSCLRVAV